MVILGVLAAALAVGLAVRGPPSRPRGGRAMSQRGIGPQRAVRRRWLTSPLLVVALAVVAAWQLIGGPTGLLVGAAAGVGTHRWITGAESAASRQRRAEIERDLPLATDLLVACLAAGRAPGVAMATVAEALPGALGDRLRSAAARLSLGGEPELVWQDLAKEPALAPLGQALARSARTGASVATALARCADDVRRQRRARAETIARSVGVRAAAPLGACFLPAFLLIGVIPTIIGAFGGLTT
jgi:Flp pilus assembly protein TadB